MKYTTVMAVWITALSAMGCQPDKTPDDPSETHSPEETLTRYTLFSRDLEFFIEHEALEAGKTGELTVYVTDLATYKPPLSGNLEVKIDGARVSSAKPVNPGIFVLEFKPENAGSFPVEFAFSQDSQSETTRTQIYVHSDDEEMPGEEPHAPGEGTGGEISFHKELAWQNDFMVQQILPQAFSAVIPTSGEVTPMPGEKKSVSASARGMVHFLDRQLVQGSFVRKGQALFSITSEHMISDNVNLRYQEARNRLDISRTEYLRHQKLFDRGAISQRQLLDTRSKYREDSLRFHALAENTSGEGILLYAPADGILHEVLVNEGSFVETGMLMATLSSEKALLIRADLPQQYYYALGSIETAHFRPAYTARVFTLEELDGSLLAAGKSVAENDHYLPVHFEVKNDGRILEGSYVEVYLKTSPQEDALVVPVAALSEEQGSFYLYVQESGESYSKRPVVPGENDGIHVQILTGLQAGERVVTRGVMLLKASTMVTGPLGHNHTH